MAAISKLKRKVWEEFWTLLCRARRGYRPDHGFLLDEVLLIDLLEQGDLEDRYALTVLQYFLNNKWKAK